jgi:hypothetical protein
MKPVLLAELAMMVIAKHRVVSETTDGPLATYFCV